MQTAERIRLVEQYQRATADSGRHEGVERERFLRNLLQRIEEHANLVTTPTMGGAARQHWNIFLRRRAARQGRVSARSFSFIIDDLRSRLGAAALAGHLSRCGGVLGPALARRLLTPAATTCLRLAAIRVVCGAEARCAPLPSSLLAGGECARHDLPLNALPGGGASGAALAVAVDNTGAHTAHGVAIEIRTQLQTEKGMSLRPAGVSAFGVIRQIGGGERAWLSFGGFDLLGEARSELAPGENLYGLRLLIARR